QATVAAISVLSSEPHEYAVQPILFSGTCKKETSKQHAWVIKMVLDACNRQKRRNNATYRTVCIASDGEAKHGDALVIQTMTSELSVDSLIYALLRPLDFLNLLVGPDDITVDKDFKHIIKCQWNVFMHNKGVEILGFCITPSILRSQLEYNGVSSHQLRSLLNPNDKQDVVLAYSLLREIWSLPLPPAGCNLTFALACRTLNIYGQFAQHLMLPYVCVNQNLDKQLIHLSTAAHLVFLLYHHNSASTHFMPRQSYLDIVLMVKNAYFCVEHAQKCMCEKSWAEGGYRKRGLRGKQPGERKVKARNVLRVPAFGPDFQEFHTKSLRGNKRRPGAEYIQQEVRDYIQKNL
ncbi:hypothetical protein EDB83DRAFT_2234413, partial [Lactarius deliciosus]